MWCCLNLDNYYRNVLLKDSLPLTRVLLEEGIEMRNEYIISDALRKLIMGIDRKQRVLTIDIYKHGRECERYLHPNRTELRVGDGYGAEILFWVNENIYLSYSNSGEKEKAVAFVEKMMDILGQYKELPDLKRDVYQNFEYAYSLYYQGIACHPTIVGYEKMLIVNFRQMRLICRRPLPIC